MGVVCTSTLSSLNIKRRPSAALTHPLDLLAGGALIRFWDMHGSMSEEGAPGSIRRATARRAASRSLLLYEPLTSKARVSPACKWIT